MFFGYLGIVAFATIAVLTIASERVVEDKVQFWSYLVLSAGAILK